MAIVYVAGKDAYFTIDKLCLTKAGSATASEVTMSHSSDELEISVMGNNWKQFIQGLSETTIAVNGVWDAGTAAAQLDAVLFGMTNNGGTKLFEFMPQGSASDRVLYSGSAFSTGYEISAPAGDIVGFTVGLRSGGTVSRSLSG